MVLLSFQFTTSQGGRPISFGVSWGDIAFQFTTSQGGRHDYGYFRIRQFETFNSRPHKEVDSDEEGENTPENLSIHDLTRRSTTPISVSNTIPDLSIHDLTRRSTAVGCGGTAIYYVFQFTTSQGGRHQPHCACACDKPFNSRPHKEVDGNPDKTESETTTLSIHDLTRRSTNSLFIL